MRFLDGFWNLVKIAGEVVGDIIIDSLERVTEGFEKASKWVNNLGNSSNSYDNTENYQQTMQSFDEGVAEFNKSKEEVSKDIEKQEAFYVDSASTYEVNHMSQVLSNITFQLADKFDNIENNAIEYTKGYFDRFVYALEDLNSQIDLGINSKKIKRELKSSLRTVQGILKENLARKISIDNYECCRVLEMEQGASKKNEIERFQQKVLQEALTEFCDKLEDILEEQQIYIQDEVNEKLDININQLKMMVRDLAELEENKAKDSKKLEMQKGENIIDLCMYHGMIELLEG